jgi:hypothetical protein
MSTRVALVSCVKSKRSAPTPACDLYTSPLFRHLRGYAEANADTWYILSAGHGLLRPDQVVAPYERTLNNAGGAARTGPAAGGVCGVLGVASCRRYGRMVIAPSGKRGGVRQKAERATSPWAAKLYHPGPKDLRLVGWLRPPPGAAPPFLSSSELPT